MVVAAGSALLVDLVVVVGRMVHLRRLRWATVQIERHVTQSRLHPTWLEPPVSGQKMNGKNE